MKRATRAALVQFIRICEFHLKRTALDAEGRAEIVDACARLTAALGEEE